MRQSTSTLELSIASVCGREGMSSSVIVQRTIHISGGNWIEYGINYPIHIIPYDSIKSSIAHLNLQVTRIDAIYWLTGVGHANLWWRASAASEEH